MRVLVLTILLCSVASIYAINLTLARINGISKINSYRARHNDTAPLTLNTTIDTYAQNHCDDLAKKTVNGVPKLFRTNFTNYVWFGETMFAAKSATLNDNVIATAADAWYSEIKHYNYSYSNFDSKYTNFSQMIWKGSKQIGLGFAQAGDITYVCAMYDPSGNSFCSFKYNVMPLKA